MRHLIFVPVLLTLIAATAQAGEAPVLGPGVLIHAGEKPISVGHTASVEVVDWNEDGKKDLLVGTFSAGNIYLFLNEGTDAAPVFSGGTKLMAGGKPLSAGCG
jgi:hypothetical protein